MARPPSPEPYTGHNVYLYQAQIAALRAAAHGRGVSISAIIRELVNKHLVAGEA